MKRPRLFFDTNIPELLRSSALVDKLLEIRKRLSESYVVVISPLTLDEMLIGIKKGDERYFQKNQAKLEVLRGVGTLRIMPSPAKFAIKRILGIDTDPPTASESIIRNTIETVLRAKSKADWGFRRS